MLFESWLEKKGFHLKKLSRKEGKELYRQFGAEILPAVKECTELLNEAYKLIKNNS